MKYLKRDIAGAVDHALGQMPVVVITGIRQSGKSTLVLEDGRFKEREYFTLNDFFQRTHIERELRDVAAQENAGAYQIPDLEVSTLRSQSEPGPPVSQ